jgi:predicted RNase H-like HicB family nuclease
MKADIGRNGGSVLLLQSPRFMALRLQMEFWKDGPWLVGRLPQVPGVFSQGATLVELEENIRDAYRMMLEEQDPAPGDTTTTVMRSWMIFN